MRDGECKQKGPRGNADQENLEQVKDTQTGPGSQARRSERWKDLERAAARKLRGRRIVRQDFFQSSPDVEVPDFRLICECKSRKRHAFHSFLEQARKYCGPDEVPALVTKSEGQHGEFVTVPMDWLAKRLDELRVLRINSRIRAAEVAGDSRGVAQALQEKILLRRAFDEQL